MPAKSGHEKMPEHPVIISGLLAKLAGAVAAALVPWVCWASGTLIRLDARLEAASVAAARIEELREEFHAHVADPALHLAGVAQIKAQLDAIQRRLDQLEGAR